jgi:hypothetical protein
MEYASFIFYFYPPGRRSEILPSAGGALDCHSIRLLYRISTGTMVEDASGTLVLLRRSCAACVGPLPPQAASHRDVRVLTSMKQRTSPSHPDQVDFSPIAWRAKIPLHQGVTQLSQMEVCVPFAPSAHSMPLRTRIGREHAPCKPIPAANDRSGKNCRKHHWPNPMLSADMLLRCDFAH